MTGQWSSGVPLPEPRPGLVLSYSYLWRHEHDEGRESGIKDRPCAVIVVAETRDGDTEVWVAPITHVEPVNADNAVEIPGPVKRHLDLDDDRSWIMVNEVNIFLWPGPDLRPLPGSRSVFHYGYLPPRLYNEIKEKILVLYRERRAQGVRRS